MVHINWFFLISCCGTHLALISNLKQKNLPWSMPIPGKMDQLRNGNGHEIELAIALFTLPLHRGVTATNICTAPPYIGHGMQNGLVIMNCKTIAI